MKDIKFINDKVVKKILTSEDEENKEYLIRIISGVTGIDEDLLKNNIKLITSEIGSNVNIVDSTVDAIFEDNKEYINIEINYNFNKTVLVKNNVYVYQMILRQVKNSKDYKKVVPAIQININNYDLFGKKDFIYKSVMMETKYFKIRDEMLMIYDINLDYLRNISYTKIKKGIISNLEKMFYLFVCDDKKVLDEIYKGDKVMNKVREDLDRITWERDAVLYYNPDEFNREIIEEEVEKKVKEEVEKKIQDEKLEIAKKLKVLNVPLEQISNATGLNVDELDKIKK